MSIDPLDAAIVVPWLALDITGQWTLFVLLLTYALGKHLPQRDNSFLINFILATFLATLPPLLLSAPCPSRRAHTHPAPRLYSGNQNAPHPPSGLCAAQAMLTQGVAPM